MRAELDFHFFLTAEQGNLSSKRFGEEIDLVAYYKWNDHFSLQGGGAYVFQGPALAEIGRLSRNMTWLYLMMDVTC